MFNSKSSFQALDGRPAATLQLFYTEKINPEGEFIQMRQNVILNWDKILQLCIYALIQMLCRVTNQVVPRPLFTPLCQYFRQIKKIINYIKVVFSGEQ